MKLDDVILALEMTGDNSKAFYDLVTRQIVWLDDFSMSQDEYEAAADALDEHGFKRLPEKRDVNEYGMMDDFSNSIGSSWLMSAIRGPGAFRRFKDAVRYMGVEQEWYHFRDEQYRRIALEWCEECGIEISDR